MAAIKICIERDDQGQFMVGIDTADQEGGDNSVEGLMQPEGMGRMIPTAGNAGAAGNMMPDDHMYGDSAEDTGMKPATDLEDALNQARALLAEPPTEQQAFAAA